MLSVSTATVPQAMRQNLQKTSTSPTGIGRTERRSWNCEYYSKRRCRPSARKKIIGDGEEESATIGLDVHCQTVNIEEMDETPPLDSSSDSPTENLNNTINNPKEKRAIPFLKSAQMKRVKISRSRQEEQQENVHEIADSSTNDDNDDEKIVGETNYQSDENEEGISSTKRMKLENSEEKSPGKLVLGSKMSRALELITRGNCESFEDSVNEGAPGIPGEEIVRDAIENFPPVVEDQGWDSDAEVLIFRHFGKENNIENPERSNNCGFMEEESPSEPDLPYFMIGFPNPPGENRCWLNATLHAMFTLPLFNQPEQLDSQQLRGCSNLTKTLMALRLFWSKGNDYKQKTYQMVKHFKESLGILDESYPSQRQQDVSEFLTMFLNYLKTDFESLSSSKSDETKNDETENIPNNVQDVRVVPRSPQTPTKRTPLADISPSKRKTHDNCDSSVQFSPKSRKTSLTYSAQDLLSPRVNRILSKPTDPSYKVHTPPHRAESALQRIKDNTDCAKNPIDKFFLLHMMEHYSCKGCAKHRQRKVDNLMLYVDLPPGSENRIVSLDEAVKTSLEPEERILTCGKCKYDKHKVFTSFRACPKILMVQVNRYGMSEDGSVAKFNTPVEIPEILQLDLGPPDADNGNSVKENFEPVCVIAHVGSAMDCGHYTSYVRHGEDWYHYNDLMVTPMSRYEALAAAQTTAYVIFFISSKTLSS